MTPAELKLISDPSSDLLRYEPLLRALTNNGLPSSAPKGNLRLPSNPKRALADMQAELGRGRG
jgi:hypothetical protein